MKLLLILILSTIPIRLSYTDKIAVIIWKMNAYTEMLTNYQKTPLYRGENKNSKQKRIRLLKRKIFVIEYNMIGRNNNVNDMQ